MIDTIIWDITNQVIYTYTTLVLAVKNENGVTIASDGMVVSTCRNRDNQIEVHKVLSNNYKVFRI